jgi:hypothetical protein
LGVDIEDMTVAEGGRNSLLETNVMPRTLSPMLRETIGCGSSSGLDEVIGSLPWKATFSSFDCEENDRLQREGTCATDRHRLKLT